MLVDYRIAANRTQSAAKGLKGGVDQDLMCGSSEATWSYTNANVQAALDLGMLDEATVNASVARVLKQKFEAGLFEQPLVDESMAATLNTDDDQALARRAAQEGTVLLANDGILPLKLTSGTSKLTVLGPLGSCDDSAAAEWLGVDVRSADDGHPDDDGYVSSCESVAWAYLGSYTQWAVDNGVEVPTVADALVASLATKSMDVPITTAMGVPVTGSGGNTSATIAAAVEAAEASDVAVMVMGDDLNTCGEWADRDDLDLPGLQLELISAVVATGTPVVLVLVNGRPATFGLNNALLGQLSAVLTVGRPGQMGGVAVADILLGDVNPSGKLAVSWPRGVGQVGGGANPWLQPVVGKWVANNVGFQDEDGRRYDNYVYSGGMDEVYANPLFYFGHGMSYTSFEYADVAVAVAVPGASDAQASSSLDSDSDSDSDAVVQVKVDVTNTGDAAGTEVVFLFAIDPQSTESNIVRHWKRLVGFARTDELAAGETSALKINVGYVGRNLHRTHLHHAHLRSRRLLFLQVRRPGIPRRGHGVQAGPRRVHPHGGVDLRGGGPRYFVRAVGCQLQGGLVTSFMAQAASELQGRAGDALGSDAGVCGASELRGRARGRRLPSLGLGHRARI